jgi:methyl-accepting chemotaxis protein
MLHRLRMRTKMGIIIAILTVAAVTISFTGYYQLRQISLRLNSLSLNIAKIERAIILLRGQMNASQHNERNAILSPGDADSQKYADLATAASLETNKTRSVLKDLMQQYATDEEKKFFEEYERNWDRYLKLQQEILRLAVSNTSLKSEELLRKQSYQLLSELRASTREMLRTLETESGEAFKANKLEPYAQAQRNTRMLERLLLLATDSTATVGIHIVSHTNEEWDGLEIRINSNENEADFLIDEALKQASQQLKPMLIEFKNKLRLFHATNKQVLQYSRQDTNYKSTIMSITDAQIAAQAAMDALDSLQKEMSRHYDEELAAATSAALFSRYFLAIVPIIGIPVGVLIAGLLTRAITRPLLNGVEVSKAIANGDLTKRPHISQLDEVGDLLRAFDTVASELSKVVGNVRTYSDTIAASASELTTISQQLLAQSEEMSKQANQVSAGAEQMSTNVSTMAAAAEQMSMNVVSISTASEEISVNVSTISNSARETSHNVSALTTALKESIRDFDEVTRQANEGSHVTSQAMALSQQATSRMNSLGKAATEINKVTDVIKMIALQTNLLALNATIEATAAGDAGKGFAVVAHEIKELANQSARAAEDITTKIEDVQANTREAIGVIQKVADIITQIDHSVTNIAQMMDRQSRAASVSSNNLNEASRGVENIANSITEVAKGATDMARNASEAAKGANDVSRNAIEAARAVREITSNIHVVGQATRDNAHGAQKVNTAAHELATIACKLQQLVKHYKTEA